MIRNSKKKNLYFMINGIKTVNCHCTKQIPFNPCLCSFYKSKGFYVTVKNYSTASWNLTKMHSYYLGSEG